MQDMANGNDADVFEGDHFTSSLPTSRKLTFVLDDELDKLICSLCDQYLTFEASTTTGIGTQICGRCQDQINGPSPALPLLIQAAYKDYLFPCVNRFDNCKQLLLLFQVADHERICAGTTRPHRCTECRYEGNGCQIYYHYFKKHPDNWLRHPMFRVNLLRSEIHNFLFRKENVLFLIQVETVARSFLNVSVRSISTLDFNPEVCLRAKSLLSEEEYFVKTLKLIDGLQGTASFSTEGASIFSNDNGLLMCTLRFDLNGGGAFKIQVEKDQSPAIIDEARQLNCIMDTLKTFFYPKLRCGTCQTFVIEPIYRCQSGHVRCEDCCTDYCSKCQDVTNWHRASDLEDFHLIPLPCRWECNGVIPPKDLRNHEKQCRARKYKCPNLGCRWTGSLANLQDHWHGIIPLVMNFRVIYRTDGLVEFYMQFNEEIFYCRVEPETTSGDRHLHVRKYSDVNTGQEGLYSIEVQIEGVSQGALVPLDNMRFELGGIRLLSHRWLINYFCFSVQLLKTSPEVPL